MAEKKREPSQTEKIIGGGLVTIGVGEMGLGLATIGRTFVDSKNLKVSTGVATARILGGLAVTGFGALKSAIGSDLLTGNVGNGQKPRVENSVRGARQEAPSTVRRDSLPAAAAPSPAPAAPSSPGLARVAEGALAANPLTKIATEVAKDPTKAIDMGGAALTTAATLQTARILTNPAVRAGAGLLSKAFVPLTLALAAYDTVKGYQKDGVKGAAEGLANSLTGGGYDLVKSQFTQPAPAVAAPATPPALVSDRLAVAQGAAQRAAAEMGQATTMGQGSMRPATAEVQSDGQTEQYTRMQGGRRVTVQGYKTPTR